VAESGRDRGRSGASEGHARGIEKVSGVVRSLVEHGKTNQHEEKPKKEGNGKAGEKQEEEERATLVNKTGYFCQATVGQVTLRERGRE